MQSKEIANLIEQVYAFAQKDDESLVVHLTNRFSIRNYLRIAEEIQYCLPGGAEILDWGSGYGHMTFFLSQLRFKVTSYELYDAKVISSLIRSTDTKVHVNKDPIVIPFPNNSFDAVLSCGVLEHVLDKEKSLSEVNRVLRKGGFLFIYMLPNLFSISELVNILMRKSDHPVRYTRNSIKKLLNKSNFEVIKVKMGNFFPKCLKSLSPALESFVKEIYNNYDLFLSLEKGFVNLPIVNIFSGTLEIIAKKI